MDFICMNICMLIKLQLEAAECVKMKDFLNAYAVFKVRLFLFWKAKYLKRSKHEVQPTHAHSIDFVVNKHCF